MREPIRGLDVVSKKIRENTKDPDYRRACIRDYILEHPDKPIKLTEFSQAAYGYENNTGGVSVILKQLIRTGRVTKHSGKGKVKSYKWHEQRLPKDPSRTNGPVIVHQSKNPSEDHSHKYDLDIPEIVRSAKDWSWSNDSDSLRKFIWYLENSNK